MAVSRPSATQANVTGRFASGPLVFTTDLKQAFTRSLCAVLLAGLAACAGSASAPTAVQSLPTDHATGMHLTDVTAEAGQGVAATPEDLNRIAAQTRADIQAEFSGMMLPSGTAPPANTMLLKIVLTRYDEGNAAARFMLAGLGQIYIEGDVLLIDSQTLLPVAKYQVSKDFSFGGLYGGITTIRDVEKGFARSVVEVVRPKT